jgi:hypothetical protein
MKVWGSGGISPLIRNSALDGVVTFTAQPPYPREMAPGTHWIGCWVGPRAGLDTVENRIISFPFQEYSSILFLKTYFSTIIIYFMLNV